MTSSQSSLGDRPSRMPPADLGSAFSGKSRSDGLGGRLAPMRLAPPPPAPERTTEADPAAPKPAKVSTPRPVKTAPAPVPAVRNDPTAAAARSDPATSSQQPIVVYVSASIRERLRTAAGDRTFTDVVLMALDATHGNLQSRFAEQPTTTKSLFAGRGRPMTRRHTEPHVQVSLRPLRDDLAVIDQLSADLNAPSRSALINAALDEFLPRDQ